MKVVLYSITMVALRGMAVLLVILLFPAHPAWSRSNVDPDVLAQALHEAHALFMGDTQGVNADYIPELAKVDPELFGLALMMTSGFYNESGAWAFEVGLPAKTGVGGGIVAVVPGKMAIVGFSPRLNQAGNSVRAMRAIEYIRERLGLGLFQ